MVSFTGTAGAAAPQRAAAAIVVGDNALAHEGPGRVVDGHQSAVGSGHAAAGALGAGRAALHQPHRLFCSGQRPAGHSHWTRRSRSPVRPPPDTRQRPGRSAPRRSHRPDRSSVYQIPSGWKNPPPPGLPLHDVPISYTCPILFLPRAALHRAYYYSLNIIAYPPTNCNCPRPSKMPPCSTFWRCTGA